VTFTLQLPAELCIGKPALPVSVASGTLLEDSEFTQSTIMPGYDGSSTPEAMFHIYSTLTHSSCGSNIKAQCFIHTQDISRQCWCCLW
jgi:hypothetical protein